MYLLKGRLKLSDGLFYYEDSWAFFGKEQAFLIDVKKPEQKFRLLNLAPRPGLEPGTCGLTVRRSTD